MVGKVTLGQFFYEHFDFDFVFLAVMFPAMLLINLIATSKECNRLHQWESCHRVGLHLWDWNLQGPEWKQFNLRLVAVNVKCGTEITGWDGKGM